MIKKRTFKIQLYSALCLVLVLFIGYANGYRLSLSQLIGDLDRAIYFAPSVIVYQQHFGDSTTVVSQHDDWLVCRSVKSILGILWHDDDLSLDPINLNDELGEKSYSQIVNQYAEGCNSLTNQTLVLDQVYRDLDKNKAVVLEQSKLQGLNLVEQGRQTTVRNNQALIDQQFGNEDITIHFFTTKYGDPIAIDIVEKADSFEQDVLLKSIKVITSNKLEGWTFTNKSISSLIEKIIFGSPWIIEDGSLKIIGQKKVISISINQ